MESGKKLIRKNGRAAQSAQNGMNTHSKEEVFERAFVEEEEGAGDFDMGESDMNDEDGEGERKTGRTGIDGEDEWSGEENEESDFSIDKGPAEDFNEEEF